MLKDFCKSLVLVFVFVACTQSEVSGAKEKSLPYQVKEWIEGRGVIWALEFLNEDELLFAEREAKLSRFNLKTLQVVEIKGLPEIFVGGQGGLLDVIKHPDFQTNSRLYLSYSIEKNGLRSTQVAQAELKENSLTNLKPLFTAEPFYKETRHFGTRLQIDQNKDLFFAIGDRGNRDFAQDLSRHNGKIIRLRDSGEVPKDNPFVGKKGARPEIWSYGHRNPQGLDLHPETGKLYANEHGPRGGDEINLIEAGKNFGWPVITYGREYYGPSIGEGKEKAGMEQPLKYFTPSIAPSSLLIYSGKLFKNWKSSFFSGALVLQHLNRVEFRENGEVFEERLLGELNERIRDVEEAPNGEIFVSTDSGKIFSIFPSAPKSSL